MTNWQKFNFQTEISEADFQEGIEHALEILDKKNYVFFSTHELFQFCKNLYIFHKHGAFHFSTEDLSNKLMQMTNHWLPLCQNYPNMNLDLGEDSGDKFVTSLLANIESTLDTLTTNQIKSNLQEQ